MKYKLVFTGIPEHRNEDTETVVRSFISQELGADDWFEFANVHRFGRYNRRRPRPIVARFIYKWQLSLILDSAKFLKGKPYGINQQYPQEIEQARRSLYPVMKQMRAEGKDVKLVRDVLFVDGEPYDPLEVSTASETQPMYASPTDAHSSAWGIAGASQDSFTRTPTHRPNKRLRYGSTPDNR